MNLAQPQAVDRPIFVIGAPRSGTTAFFEAFAHHEALGWFPHLLNRLRRGPLHWLAETSPRIYSLPGMRRIGRGEKAQGQGLKRFNRLLPRPDECYPEWERYCGPAFRHDFLLGAVADDETRVRLNQGVARLLRRQGKQRFAAKITGPPRMGYLRSVFPDAQFIHITRQACAVVASLLHVSFWRDNGGLSGPWWSGGLPAGWEKTWDEHDRDPAILAGMQWAAILSTARRERAALPEGAYLEIRYEDFVQRPREALEQAFDFAALPASPAALAFISQPGRFVDRNERADSRLTPRQRAALERLLAAELAAYGYPTDAPVAPAGGSS